MFRDINAKPSKWFISHKIEIRDSDIHELGVFAKEPIERHEIIECSPVIIFDKGTLEVLTEYAREEFGAYSRHILMDYPFQWDINMICIGWGYTGIYNHAKEPNARWNVIKDIKGLQFRTLRKIEKDEELCTAYIPKIGMPDDNLWF